MMYDNETAEDRDGFVIDENIVVTMNNALYDFDYYGYCDSINETVVGEDVKSVGLRQLREEAYKDPKSVLENFVEQFDDDAMGSIEDDPELIENINKVKAYYEAEFGKEEKSEVKFSGAVAKFMNEDEPEAQAQNEEQSSL